MDNSLAKGISTAGDVEFKRLELIDLKNSNRRYNLLGAFVDLTIYEDLFSPVLSGYVALIESQNLISTIPIVGDELIYAEFSTPSLTTLKCLFHITKVGVREHGDKKNAYTLDFISYEGFVDLSQRLSIPLSGNPSELISTFYKSTFRSTLIDVDQSDNYIKFISPYWSPFKIINHATCRAVYPNNKMITPNYLFYQTNKGHKFKSLTTLMGQRPAIDYVFDKNPARLSLNDGTSSRDISREFRSIKELTFVASQDYVKNMLNGAYNHSVLGTNLLRKFVDLKTYSFKDNFSKTLHTDAYPLTTLAAPKSSGLQTIQNTYPNLFNGVRDISDEIIAKRISLLAQLETWKLNIVVHGRTDMEVGMIVNIWLNQFKTIDSSDKNSPDTYDKIYSGKYLITAISHRFTMSKHEMNMEVIKDSSYSEIIAK